jgi:hypothetical protein
MDTHHIPLRDKNAVTTAARVKKEIEDLLSRVDVAPDLDSRQESDIVGYGDDGIPR